MRKICTIIFLLITYSSYSQSLLFIGEKSYPSTGSFSMKSNMNQGEILEVNIAKRQGGGIISLTTNILGGNNDFCPLFIRGKAIIYLDNGNVISCVDRGIYDTVDNTATTVYYLTSSEIEVLKKSNINTIRYSIKPKSSTCMSSQSGNFSASLVSTSHPTFENGKVKYVEHKVNVPDLIKELFE